MTQWTDWIDRQKQDKEIANDVDVAKAAGYSKTLISNWRTGKSEVSPERAIATARGLGVPVGEALAAAGFIERNEWSSGVATPDPTSLADGVLIGELQRRLAAAKSDEVEPGLADGRNVGARIRTTKPRGSKERENPA